MDRIDPRALTPLGGYEPRGGEDSYQTLLAALVAHGTSLGVAAMSSSIEGMAPDRLHHASQWFLREATLKAASKAVVDHHHRLAFSRTWGEGRLSSSDGQCFAVQRDGLLGAAAKSPGGFARYPRYFGYYDRAITFYTHLSDQFRGVRHPGDLLRAARSRLRAGRPAGERHAGPAAGPHHGYPRIY